MAFPALVSSLFPHLPRASHGHFRIALGSAGGCVVALALLGWFPIALIATALALPLLVVVYLIDVNLYEEESWWAVAATVAWGAITGLAFGILARAVSPDAADVLGHGGSQLLVWQGLVLPFLGLLVLLVAPLAMLRNRGFASVLDGVTFGASSAAAFGGAQAIAFNAPLIADGIHPGGATLPWIWRLTALGLAQPIVVMGAGAGVCAAVWLRYRAPARDAEALGPAGHPTAAVPLAAVLVMAAAAGEAFLPALAWLVWLVAVGVVVIVLLRRAIHVGLLEESLEVEIGPPIMCPNCGRLTDQHTFCSQCGISLQALPKARSADSWGVVPPGRPA